ncbi:MAG: YceI family protein [Lentimicrobiaceae bacterium]|nr:YceI family protein [Lentimicrobiaceae bacterium]
MKKSFIYFGVAAMASFLVACNNPQGDRAAISDSQEVTLTEGDAYVGVDVDKSTIKWEGSKPTGKHHGTIDIKEGDLILVDGKLAGGKFLIDMTSIVNEDLTDAEQNQKLVNHLKSPDFFHVEEFPVATFEITAVTPAENGTDKDYNITGNLTMKDISKSVTFPAVVEVSENSVDAKTPPFIIDRSHWNVQFGSRTFFKDLQDKFINDEIVLNIHLVASN